MFPVCVFLTLMLPKPEDMAFSSGGNVSPAQRQICGDREHLGRRIPLPGACCHLRVSPCSELTFLFHRLPSDSSPPLRRCRCKLVYKKKKHRGSRCDSRGRKLFSRAQTEPVTLTAYTSFSRPSLFAVSQADSGILQESAMQPRSQGRTVSLMSSPWPGQVLLFWSHGGGADPRYHGRED